MSTWETWKGEWEKPTFKREPHSFQPWKFWSKGLCSTCGLLYLNNPLTKWAVQQGCNWTLHPEFREKVKQLTNG